MMETRAGCFLQERHVEREDVGEIEREIGRIEANFANKLEKSKGSDDQNSGSDNF